MRYINIGLSPGPRLTHSFTVLQEAVIIVEADLVLIVTGVLLWSSLVFTAGVATVQMGRNINQQLPVKFANCKILIFKIVFIIFNRNVM